MKRVITLSSFVLVLGSPTMNRDSNEREHAFRGLAALSSQPSIRIADKPSRVFGGGSPARAAELVDVIAATRLSNGNVAIADRGLYEVQVYDERGSLVGKSGRRGEGPGDYVNLTRMWAGRGDTLFVYDMTQRRVSVLQPSGRFVRSWPRIEVSGRLLIDGMFADGRLLAELDIRPNPPTQTGIERRFKRFLLVEPGGRIVDSVPGVFFRGETLVFVGEKGPIGSARAPLSKFGHTEVHNDAIYYGDATEFSVRQLNARGTPIRELRHPHTIVPLTAQERDDIVTKFTSSPRMPSGFSELLKAELGRFLARGEFARYDSLLVDKSGRVWMRDNNGFSKAHREWVVLQSSGAIVGRVQVSVDRTILEIGTNYVLISETNSSGFLVVAEYPLFVTSP